MRTEPAHQMLGRRGQVLQFVGRPRMLVGVRMLGGARLPCSRGDRALAFGPFYAPLRAGLASAWLLFDLAPRLLIFRIFRRCGQCMMHNAAAHSGTLFGS